MCLMVRLFGRIRCHAGRVPSRGHPALVTRAQGPYDHELQKKVFLDEEIDYPNPPPATTVSDVDAPMLISFPLRVLCPARDVLHVTRCCVWIERLDKPALHGPFDEFGNHWLGLLSQPETLTKTAVGHIR